MVWGSNWNRPLSPGSPRPACSAIPDTEICDGNVVQKMEPEQLFTFTWHPGAIEPAVDYSKEPFTLVEFRLEETGDGPLLSLTESGFANLPSERRAEAFRMNEGGWEKQIKNIERHVAP